MDKDATDAVVSQAESVQKLGRIHHQIAQFHKRQAKLCMQRFDDFRQQLAALGIKLEINGEEERKTLHGQQTERNQRSTGTKET